MNFSFHFTNTQHFTVLLAQLNQIPNDGHLDYFQSAKTNNAAMT